jgi:hypothetical protein
MAREAAFAGFKNRAVEALLFRDKKILTCLQFYILMEKVKKYSLS